MFVDLVGVGDERLPLGDVEPVGPAGAPIAFSRSSVSASPSVSTSLIASFAPERASSIASARPMPEPAPVTTATLPAKPCMRALPSVGCVERSWNQGTTQPCATDVAHIHTTRGEIISCHRQARRGVVSAGRADSARVSRYPDDWRRSAKPSGPIPKTKRRRPALARRRWASWMPSSPCSRVEEAPTVFLGIWRSRALCVRRYLVRPRISSMIDAGRRRR